MNEWENLQDSDLFADEVDERRNASIATGAEMMTCVSTISTLSTVGACVCCLCCVCTVGSEEALQ